MCQIVCSDCLKYLQTCEGGGYDLVIADPPYFEIYGDFDFGWTSLDEYLDWSKKWIIECCRVLKPTGSFYLWGKIGFGKGFALFKLADWIEATNLLTIRNWITQRNSRGRGTKKGYMEAREELLFMTKGDHYTWNTAYTDEPSNRTDPGFDGKPRKNLYKRCSDVWIDIAEASQSSLERFKLPDGTAFPTVKAQKLCERIILASSNPGDRVLVPFGGSGSEAVACVRLGRTCTVVERNETFVQYLIRPRLEKTSLDEMRHERSIGSCDLAEPPVEK